ncbi:NACHT, LRR and PYD domains-containing protein 12-like isoform X2 [Triplophysa dalaica]|uniref:NACHT, LRR and PYD domains-containing protein 12-like isoform X2 n=1 Tax=Triplophysa dalaica TaxID=1582913 RepID=UPI0024DFBEFC|nr:NACHT, LRR and PYD domains-containing protein 12-like isoform X2 [Triplophysa dalaica]
MNTKGSVVTPNIQYSHSEKMHSIQDTKATTHHTQTDPVTSENTTDHNDLHDHGSKNCIQSMRRDAPGTSCVSMKSNLSADAPPNLRDKDRNSTHSIQSMRRDAPGSSCVSMKSNRSLPTPPELQDKDRNSTHSCLSMKSNHSMDPPLKLERERPPEPVSVLSGGSGSLSPVPSCLSMKSNHSMDPPLKFEGEHPTEPVLDQPWVGDKDTEILQGQMCNEVYKSHLRKKFECLYEGTSQQRNPTLLNEIYTELYITESESGEISNEHEVRQIETQSRRTATEDTPIKCNDIFKALPAQDKPIRSVLTKGVAGIGKTVSVQKFILDWAEGKENQDVHLIFPLPFREINLMKNQTLSLLDLLHLFFPETKEMEISSGEYKVLFIFDGLDECRVSLDFHSSVRLCDVSESASVDVILTNLMKGNLLPSALIWITSRPAAADLIPSECVDRVTEVRGFTDKQKEEYFSKRISDESLNNRIISHLKSSRSLYIMCHIPVFCWISATVLERMLSEAESEGEIPKTLTQMYTHFLIIQTNIKHQKDYEKKVKNDEDMIFKLGKLAFEQLVKGNLIFYDEDLRECGIDVAEASVYSGLCTQIFREEFGLYQGKVYCFVHLTIQEHLAALYVHTSFRRGDTGILYYWKTSNIATLFKCSTISELHKTAVDKMLQSKKGHFDLFLRFLLGLSLDSNQALLHHILPQTSPVPTDSVTETTDYIKIRIRMNLPSEKYISLFHCLNELNDFSLVEEIQNFQKSRKLSKTKLSASQWAALVFVLLSSENTLDVFDLRKYSQNDADECLEKMLPVVMEAKTAELRHCNLRSKGFQALRSALGSKSSSLKQLKLSGNRLSGPGMKILSEGLQQLHCKLETLELSECGLTPGDCSSLSKALDSNPSHLMELDLTFNQTGDAGVKTLSRILKKPNCALQKLILVSCGLKAESCKSLAEALSRNSALVDLDLSKNNLMDSGLWFLCDGLKSPSCKLKTLSLEDCGVTEQGCRGLCSALRSNSLHLTELRLNRNKIQNSGVKMISNLLKEPQCKLEKLRLSFCDVTERGGADVALALRLNPAHLRELDLSGNKLGPAKKLLTALQEHSDYKLEKLKID